MIYYYRKLNLVCFDIQDIRNIFEAPSREWLRDFIFSEASFLAGGFPYFLRDKDKMLEIANQHSLLNDKDDVEIFTAAYMMLTFFPKESRVCFYMKDGFNPNKHDVNSLESLKKNIKENHHTDVCLLSNNNLRAFQLKNYKGNCSTAEFMCFLTKKLKHYAFDLGTTNLYITLGSSGEIEEDLFRNIHDQLNKLNLKGTGEILVTYNENNKFDVLNTVYPILGTHRVPYGNLSGRL
jgi:hypothetical protein